MSRALDEHREYLTDPFRIAAFRRAIHATVRPGDVVLDLACGTGILGLMACEAGAARVYAIDEGEIIEMARAIARANGCADRIVHVHEHSSHVTLPERADVLVFDQIGRLGFDAGVLEFAADARARLLKPDARMVPLRVTLDAALVASPVMRSHVDFWGTTPAGIDCTPALSTAYNTGYPMDAPLASCISETSEVMTFDPSAWGGESFSSTIAMTAREDARADGLAGWFRAELSPGVWMTNAPFASDRINRRPAFLPFERSLDLRAGERVTASLRVLPADSILSWEITREATGERFAHSTWKGMLPTREALTRTRADAVPRLSDRGVARKTVLDLCDGARTVRDIEAALASRHPDLFPDAQSAAVFTAEVLSVYARG